MPSTSSESVSQITSSSCLPHLRPDPIIPNHQRIFECQKESQILVWCWKVLNEVPVYYYDHYLWDGSVLCRMMNAISNGSIKRKIIDPAEHLDEKRTNIESFLSAAEAYGVKKDKLFHLFDLLLLQNIPKVTSCIFELARLAKDDSNCHITAHLGQITFEPLDPRFPRKSKSGVPQGDDLYTSHVDIHRLLNKLIQIKQQNQQQQQGHQQQQQQEHQQQQKQEPDSTPSQS